MPAQHDVELVGDAIERDRCIQVECRDKLVDGAWIGDGFHDWTICDQGVAFEIHLGDQPLGEGCAEDRHMDMGGPPVVHPVAPGIGTRLDGAEDVAAVLIRERPPTTADCLAPSSWATDLGFL